MRKRILRSVKVETADLLSIIGEFNPILSSEETSIKFKHIKDDMIVTMTKTEFENWNKSIIDNILINIDVEFPDASLSKKSKLYSAIRNAMYEMLANHEMKSIDSKSYFYRNKKASISQGSVLEVA